jgi:hypothetical protein
VPSAVTVQGLTHNAAAASGTIRFPALRRPVSITRGSANLPSWLNIETVATASSEWRWQISAAGLAPGKYTAAQPLAAAGGTVEPSSVTFTLYVDSLRPSPSELTAAVRRGETASVAVRAPAGSSGLAFSIVSDQPWIKPEASAAVSPTELAVRLAAEDLEPGVYRGMIALTPNGVAADAVRVPVVLTVI